MCVCIVWCGGTGKGFADVYVSCAQGDVFMWFMSPHSSPPHRQVLYMYYSPLGEVVISDLVC